MLGLLFFFLEIKLSFIIKSTIIHNFNSTRSNFRHGTDKVKTEMYGWNRLLMRIELI